MHDLDPPSVAAGGAPTGARGCGYCDHAECPDYGRRYLLAAVPPHFECPVCLRRGRIARERGLRTGTSDLFSECRVEFDYDPARAAYREVARVYDARVLGRHDIYVLQSPLVRTRDEAVRTAGALLKSLNASLASRPPTRRTPTRAQLLDEGWPISL